MIDMMKNFFKKNKTKSVGANLEAKPPRGGLASKFVFKKFLSKVKLFFKKVLWCLKHPRQTWRALWVELRSFFRHREIFCTQKSVAIQNGAMPWIATREYALAKTIRKKFKHFVCWCWATLPRRIVSSILIALFILAPIYNILFVLKASAEWWNDSWLYRKSVAVTNNTTAQTNIYIALTLDTSDTSKFQTDCGDLRFTNTTGNLQDYFIVSGCGTASTSVHVNLQTFPAGLQNIFYYYGNPTAPNGFSNTDFSTQATSYTVGSLGSEEKSTGPVAFWKFDEGFGTTAQDSTVQNNDGTLTNMATVASPTSGWQTDDQCIAGKCLAFDGSDDKVAISNFQFPVSN